mmetsp:Transcript_15956/g.21735  ORF Transcript_15956/g.21735 Transcript_15956/m.21735 type:complete len:501 (+) Transcript_15956:367-1869(+)
MLALACCVHLLVGGSRLAEHLRLFHLLVSGSNLLILNHHLDGLGSLQSRVLDHDGDGRLDYGIDAEDVARDLVAELDSTRLQAEECRVATLLLGCLALNGELESGTGGDILAQSDNLGVHAVARSLHELSAGGPCGLTVVAHPPGLAEDVTADDLVLVREALLDEAGRVTDLLLSRRLRLSLALPTMVIRIHLEVLLLNRHASSSTLGEVLTDKLGGGLRRLANLKERVFVDTLALTGGAVVGVGLDRAHVADAFNGVCVTAIADDFFVNSFLLFNQFLGHVVLEKALEAREAVIFDLLADKRRHGGKLTRDKSAAAVALAAGEALLVHLGAVALDAGDLLETLGLLVVRGNEQVASHIRVLHLHLHLGGLVLHLLDDAVAAHVPHIRLSLRGHVAHLHSRVDHLLRSLDALRVAALLRAHSQGHHLGASRDRMLDRVVVTDGGLMRDLVDHVEGWMLIDNALGQLVVADRIEVGFDHHEGVLGNGAATAEHSALTQHLR